MGVAFKSYLVEKNIEYSDSNQVDSPLPQKESSKPSSAHEEKNFWEWLRDAQRYSFSMDSN